LYLQVTVDHKANLHALREDATHKKISYQCQPQQRLERWVRKVGKEKGCEREKMERRKNREQTICQQANFEW